MKLWDQAWLALAQNESLEILDFFRYVDDVRNCLFALKEGWRWDGQSFSFCVEWEQEDMDSNVSDQMRTTLEISKAMSSLISYLEFEG